MTRTEFSITVQIPAPPTLVWSVLVEVERWPKWTVSISRVKKLSLGPLQVGSRVRIHQPKLPPALWRVTELNPGANFTWVSRATLSIRYEGLVGKLLAQWVGELNDRYLKMEANGLKARCSELAPKLELETI